MLVRDVMSRRPWTVTTGTSVSAAIGLLAEHGLTSMPVVDGRRHIVGVVSEADLIREALVPDPRAQETPRDDVRRERAHTVGELMTRQVVTVHESTDLVDAVELLTSLGVKSLPVVDPDDRVVGVVSRSDVVRALARTDDTVEREVDAALVALGHSDWLVEAHDGVVKIDGPLNLADVSLARSVAHSIRGVVEVRVG